MRGTFRLQLVLLALCSSAALPTRAQVSELAGAVDTVGHRAAGIHLRYYLGTLTQLKGPEIIAYLPGTRAGYGGGKLIYFLPAPSKDRLGQRKTINIRHIDSMRVHGRVYKTVRHHGKTTDVLAWQLIRGPISLATYADSRSLLLPLPLLGVGMPSPIFNIPLSDKNRWYVQRGGDYTELHRASFAEAMSIYLADNPTLAAKVAHGDPNYQFADVPAIVTEYNAAKAGR